MKKLFLSVAFVCLTLSSFAQECVDLFITEIVFERDSVNPQNFIKNYSLELFNPQDVPISLTGYTIKLIPMSGTPTSITITDSILPKGTYVISNRHADSAVQQLTDLLSDYLDYPSYRQIELWNGTILLDKIGKDGVVDPDSIDLMQALLDPAAYLDQLDLDLTSLQNLVIRRNPARTHGNPNFDSLAQEWYVFPNGMIDDLNDYYGICRGGVVIQFPNQTLSFSEGDPFFAAVPVEALGYDGSGGVSVDVYQQAGTPPGFTPPTYLIDAIDQLIPSYENIYFSFATENLYLNINNDNTAEPNEVVFFRLENPINAVVNASQMYAQITVTNDDASSVDDVKNASIGFVTFPNPTDAYTFIRLAQGLKTERTVLVNSLGQTVYKNLSLTTVISLEGMPPGVYQLQVQINGELYTEQIIKR